MAQRHPRRYEFKPGKFQFSVVQIRGARHKYKDSPVKWRSLWGLGHY